MRSTKCSFLLLSLLLLLLPPLFTERCRGDELGAGLNSLFLFTNCRWDEGGGQSVRGEHRSAGSSVEDPGAGAVAVRRAQDTEGVQLRGQEAGRPVRVQQMRKIVHEEGLVAETRALGVREGATVSMPILPATVQAESSLAPTHTPPTFGQNRGHGGIPARVHAQARDRLKK